MRQIAPVTALQSDLAAQRKAEPRDAGEGTRTPTFKKNTGF